MFSSPLMIDENTSIWLSQSASKHALDFPAWCLMSKSRSLCGGCPQVMAQSPIDKIPPGSKLDAFNG
jgi:hypothetical protein